MRFTYRQIKWSVTFGRQAMIITLERTAKVVHYGFFIFRLALNV